MKPRITLRRTVWSCCLPDWARTRIVGMGYTPKEAYDDWVMLGGKGGAG